MQKVSLFVGIIGLLAGSLLTIAITSSAVNSNNSGMMRMMGIRTGSSMDMMDDTKGNHMGMSMENMTSNLENKSGDAFDKIFIAEMIDHHQGAIDMAKLAQKNAKHDDVKKLAAAIIAAQTTEIDQMKSWQNQWGY